MFPSNSFVPRNPFFSTETLSVSAASLVSLMEGVGLLGKFHCAVKFNITTFKKERYFNLFMYIEMP